MSNVSYMRPELQILLNQYKTIRDCIAGQEVVKDAGEWYLPKPNSLDSSAENKARYEAYRHRAMFYGATGRTVQGFVGQVFAEEPQIKLPPLLVPMQDDATGAGVGLVSLAQTADSYVTAYGRAGLWVDYPATIAPTTRADLLRGDVHPIMQVFSPDTVINWRVQINGAKKKLILVVIQDMYIMSDDGFEIKLGPMWRVLRLEQGVYTVSEFIQATDGTGQIVVGKFVEYRKYIPTLANGISLDYIPFTFIGAVNNDTNPDHPPMYSIAALNIGHYRNSADFEEASYVVGQPTLVITGLTEAWVKDQMGGVARMGAAGGIPLPVGADAKLLQAAPNTLPQEAMLMKERQMVALGAKLVEQKQVQRTLGEAEMENGAEQSIITTIAKNVSRAFTQGLKWAAAFAGAADAAIEFELNTDFQMNNMTAQDRAELIKEWQSGAVSWTEMRQNLRRSGITFQDDVVAKAEIEADMQAQVDFQNENTLENPNHPNSPNNPDNQPPVEK